MRLSAAQLLSAGVLLAGAGAVAGFVAARRNRVEAREIQHETGAAGEPTAQAVEQYLFRRIYLSHRPVPVKELIEDFAADPTRIEPHLADLQQRGRLIRNGDDEVLAISGLSAVPTRHAFVNHGVARFTWCAWDALGIGLLLRQGTVVRTLCPQTGAPIEVRFRSRRIVASPQTAVLVLPVRSSSCVTVEEWCPQVNLLADELSAKLWLKATGSTARILTAADAAHDAALAFRSLVAPLAQRGQISGRRLSR